MSRIPRLLLLTAALQLAGCGAFGSGREPVQLSESTLYDSRVVAAVPDLIRRDCRLDGVLARYIDHEADDLVMMLRTAPTQGRYLRMIITGMSLTPLPGPVTLEVQGELLDDDMVKGSFRAGRRSATVATNVPGACALLRELAKDIAEDIADWLARPSMNARLGPRSRR